MHEATLTMKNYWAPNTNWEEKGMMTEDEMVGQHH